MINFAHRGASAYAPENTFASFYMGLQMGANGIETDIQRTKDGVLVLFHDDRLERVLGLQGRIQDYTLEELSCAYVLPKKNHLFPREPIVRLEDFLYYFGPKELRFALELKQPGLEIAVLELLDRYRMREKCEITSFDFMALEAVKKQDARVKTGWLCEAINGENIRRLGSWHMEQICPRADRVTKEGCRQAKDAGLEVRAWGVRDQGLMERMISCGVDGMTVNFPDKLAQAISL